MNDHWKTCYGEFPDGRQFPDQESSEAEYMIMVEAAENEGLPVIPQFPESIPVASKLGQCD